MGCWQTKKTTVASLKQDVSSPVSLAIEASGETGKKQIKKKSLTDSSFKPFSHNKGKRQAKSAKRKKNHTASSFALNVKVNIEKEENGRKSSLSSNKSAIAQRFEPKNLDKMPIFSRLKRASQNNLKHIPAN